MKPTDEELNALGDAIAAMDPAIASPYEQGRLAWTIIAPLVLERAAEECDREARLCPDDECRMSAAHWLASRIRALKNE